MEACPQFSLRRGNLQNGSVCLSPIHPECHSLHFLLPSFFKAAKKENVTVFGADSKARLGWMSCFILLAPCFYLPWSPQGRHLHPLTPVFIWRRFVSPLLLAPHLPSSRASALELAKLSSAAAAAEGT